MTPQEQIDFMIKALQIAKEELDYNDTYNKWKKDDEKKGLLYSWQGKTCNKRNPNGTLIRENLKTVGRLAPIVANEIKVGRWE